jgi:hypothetical protein
MLKSWKFLASVFVASGVAQVLMIVLTPRLHDFPVVVYYPFIWFMTLFHHSEGSLGTVVISSLLIGIFVYSTLLTFTIALLRKSSAPKP